MWKYILRRLLLLPVTLLFIVLVNFIIINLAPGEPTSLTEISAEGMARKEENGQIAFGQDQRYLQFREHFGLTLPIIFNVWPWTTLNYTKQLLKNLLTKKEEMSVSSYDKLRIHVGDRARFMMPQLLSIIIDPNEQMELREMASRFYARGGTRQAFTGAKLSPEKKRWNQKIAKENSQLRQSIIQMNDSSDSVDKKVTSMKEWFEQNQVNLRLEPTYLQKLQMLVTETRFFRYFSRVLTFDFGTLRDDPHKTVISEVAKRFKYSLTLSLLPMIITFVLCQIFGFTMATGHGRISDWGFNLLFLILYAIPIFVAAPFLIEMALYRNFPFTNIPIPTSGFTSEEFIYQQETSMQRIFDVARHIFLPIVAIMYGSLATSSRLSRTAVLEVMRQDYIRTAKAKGLSTINILVKHVGRNAAITIVTSIAGSLGIVLGGSLIIETLFEINGFGKFFYDAILNRDYNVIMFSIYAGSFLSLLGYLVADISYTLLDPRVTLE